MAEIGGRAGVTPEQLASAVASLALKAEMPTPATSAPKSEATAPVVGQQPTRYALEDHQHGRLTSSTYETTGATGLKDVMFTRAFDAPPTAILTPMGDFGTSPVPQATVTEWIRGGVGGNQYTGAKIKAVKMAAQTLAAVNVVGVQVAVGAQTITGNTTAAGNQVFSCLFVANSSS